MHCLPAALPRYTPGHELLRFLLHVKAPREAPRIQQWRFRSHLPGKASGWPPTKQCALGCPWTCLRQGGLSGLTMPVLGSQPATEFAGLSSDQRVFDDVTCCRCTLWHAPWIQKVSASTGDPVFTDAEGALTTNSDVASSTPYRRRRGWGQAEAALDCRALPTATQGLGTF